MIDYCQEIIIIDSFFMMGLLVWFVLAVLFKEADKLLRRQLQFLKNYSDCQRGAQRFHCFKTFKEGKGDRERRKEREYPEAAPGPV